MDDILIVFTKLSSSDTLWDHTEKVNFDLQSVMVIEGEAHKDYWMSKTGHKMNFLLWLVFHLSFIWK
jgi:hypothetical protein